MLSRRVNASSGVYDDLVGHFLPLAQVPNAGALNSADMQENITPAVIWLNEDRPLATSTSPPSKRSP